MSFLKNMFGTSDDNLQSRKLNWNNLEDLGQLNEIIDLSTNNAIVIFKHSTRCSISRMALKQFESEMETLDKVTFYFLDLLQHRAISNAITSQFSVHHQSPQLLLIKDGKCVYDASHSDIDASVLIQKL